MAILSVEVPDQIAKTFQPFTIIKYEVLVIKDWLYIKNYYST